MTYTKENPLRVVTLCSGYDSQCLALNRLRETFPDFDYELVAWAEFDPESKSPIEKQPAVIAHNALFPKYADRNLGDMTKIDWGAAGLRPPVLLHTVPEHQRSRTATRICRRQRHPVEHHLECSRCSQGKATEISLLGKREGYGVEEVSSDVQPLAV